MPDCRVYELVSPAFREGGVPIDQPAEISSNGNILDFGFGGVAGAAGNEPYDPNRGSDVVAYRLERDASGWSYRVLTPPAVPYERSTLLGIARDPNLSTTLWGAQAGAVIHKEDMYMQTGDGQLHLVGPAEVPNLKTEEIDASEELTLVGASSDLSHSFYSITNEPVSVRRSHDVWPGDTTRAEASSLYEYSYQGEPEPEPTLVGVRNQTALEGRPHINEGAEVISDCGTVLGSLPRGSAYNAVSQDGGTVFFTAKACEGVPQANELYARLGGARTVAISEPSKEDCEVCNTTSGVKDARFVGASADGQRAFFTTEQALLPGKEGMNLYMYDFAAPAASPIDPDGKISTIASVAKPEIQGVVRISNDGSHVYFVAKGVLAGPDAEGHRPEVGADNLYLYEPNPSQPGTSHVVFIATLLTPSQETEDHKQEATLEAEAEVKADEFWEAHCPPAFIQFSCFEEVAAVLEREEMALGYFDIVETLREDRAVWGGEDARPVQATTDGRFLVFVSSAHLTADDSSSIPQLFEYDAQGGASSGGSLRRVSIGQGGSYDNDGNVDSFSEAPHIPRQVFAFSDLSNVANFGLVVSEDGSRVFFTSAAPLTPLAVSGSPSVFEYREGNVYLISDGQDSSMTDGMSSVQLYGTDPSGRDVFFTTADQLVPQAEDTEQALYDAREEGGFPMPALGPGCLGETCRGLGGERPALTPGGTIVQAGEENSHTLPSSSTLIKSRSNHIAAARAKRLARALKACNKVSVSRRRGCRIRARKLYR